MFKCTVKIFGFPAEITDRNEVELELRDGATMADVVAALREKIPSLEGPVIRKGEDRLQELYKFNINGQFFFDGRDFELKDGDSIALLPPVTGG